MRKQIVVSDFSGDPIADGDVVQITLRFPDRRRGVYVAEAAHGDEIVRLIVSSGRKQMHRGRKPKGEGLDEQLVERAGRSGAARAKVRS